MATPRYPLNKMRQPGSIAFDLSLAGTWARATTLRLPGARRALHLRPEEWTEAADAVSALLSLFLAVKHTIRVCEGAPWLGVPPPLPLKELRAHLGRAEQFRDALMHTDKKVSRVPPEQESAIAAALAANPGVPHGYVAFGIDFDAQGAHLYSLVGKRGRAAKTRVVWDDGERVAHKIDAWALDLFANWDDV